MNVSIVLSVVLWSFWVLCAVIGFMFTVFLWETVWKKLRKPKYYQLFMCALSLV